MPVLSNKNATKGRSRLLCMCIASLLRIIKSYILPTSLSKEERKIVNAAARIMVIVRYKLYKNSHHGVELSEGDPKRLELYDKGF